MQADTHAPGEKKLKKSPQNPRNSLEMFPFPLHVTQLAQGNDLVLQISDERLLKRWRQSSCLEFLLAPLSSSLLFTCTSSV